MEKLEEQTSSKNITYFNPLECSGYLAYDSEGRVVACESTYGDAKLEARWLGVRCPIVVHSDVIKRAHRGSSI